MIRILFALLLPSIASLSILNCGQYADELAVCKERAKLLYNECLASYDLFVFLSGTTPAPSEASQKKTDVFLQCTYEYIQRKKCPNQKSYLPTKKRNHPIKARTPFNK